MMSEHSRRSWTTIRSVFERPLGTLALHELLCVRAPPLVILTRLATAPTEAKVKLGETRYPLHFSIEEGFDDTITIAILAAHPEAAHAVDAEDGSTALHLACSHGASDHVVTALIAANPAAAAIADEDGALPIHLAAEHGAPVDVVIPLHRAHPAGVATADASGRLPLHLAAAHGAPEAVVATLLLHHWQSHSSVDNLGKRALDYALERADSRRGVRAVLTAANELASPRDEPASPADDTAAPPTARPASPGSRSGSWRRMLPGVLRRESTASMSGRAAAACCLSASAGESPMGTPLGAAPAAVLCN